MKRSWRPPRAEVLDGADELADELLLRHWDDIDLAYVASALGAVLVYAPMARGEGSTLRAPGGAVLTVDLRLEGTPEGRFVGAHEAGHLRLHPDVGLSAWCQGASGSFFQREIDASDFGSRLLTPSPLVRAWLAGLGALGRGPSLHVVQSFAKAFRVPLALALLRLVDELAALAAPVAVVHTRGGVVRWWSASDDFPFPVTKQFTLGPTAQAATTEALARHEAHGEQEHVAAEAWSKHRRARGAKLLEHSVRFPGGEPDAALTLLTYGPCR